MKSNAVCTVSSAASGSPRPWSSSRATQIRGIGSSGRSSRSRRYCASASSRSPLASDTAAASATTSGFLRSMRWQRSTIEAAVSILPASRASKPRSRSLSRRSIRDMDTGLPRFAAVRRPRYRREVTIALRIVFLAWIAILAACPGRQTRRTLVPEVPTTGDAAARNRFQDARAKFLRDGKDTGEFKRIVEEFPEDPIVPWAQLYSGIADVKARNLREAVKALHEVVEVKADPGLTARAQLFLGIAKNYQGDSVGARELLRSSDRAIEDDNDRTEYLAALAYATAAAGDPPIRSLAVFDQLYPRVTPTERAAIVLRIEEVVAATDPNLVRRAFDELPDRKGPSFAVVASRLVVLAEQSGNQQEAQRMREIAAPARAALGLPRGLEVQGATLAGSGGGLLGAVVPLGGKSNRIAEAAVAGLGLAAGVGDGNAVAAVEVRAAGDGEAVGLAVEELARANVVAIIGPTDKDAVAAAGPSAGSAGAPR